MRTVIFIVQTFIKSTMRMITTKALKHNTAVIAASIFIICTVIFSDNIRTAASEAVGNCLNIIIPCIFPVTALSFFILELGFPVRLKHFTDKILCKAFGLSGNCLEAVLLGLTGGYVTAIKCAVKLKNELLISNSQAKRIALFFTNPGISFTVLLTGVSLTGSLAAGIRIYFETVILNILSGYLYNKYNKNTTKDKITKRHRDITSAFTSAVDSASRAIINISFNIIIFTCITEILGNILPFTAVTQILRLTSEVSTAVLYSASAFPLYITAGVLTFGGICIFIQVLSDLKELDIKPMSFIFVRLIHGIIITIAEYICLKVFPESVYASALYQVHFSASADITGTLSLIFMCIAYLISVRKIKRIKSSTKKVR